MYLLESGVCDVMLDDLSNASGPHAKVPSSNSIVRPLLAISSGYQIPSPNRPYLSRYATAPLDHVY